ncbi:MAG: outer membrane protein assembly factor BamB family protein, partial [Caldimonas sp.]
MSSTALAASPTPPAGAASAAVGEWPVVGHDPQGTRFSPLDQINAGNVGSLKLAFSFPTGIDKGHEAAPLVIGDTMYLVTPYPNTVYAFDLNEPNAAKLKWKFDPKPQASSQGIACCDVVNRGAAFADGRLFINSLDAQTIAIDAASGRELWRTKLGDISKGETMTMAPLVVQGKVLVGNSGGEMGVRGWLTALDAATGKIAWRAWSTGPDKDVLIGPDFKPF